MSKKSRAGSTDRATTPRRFGRTWAIPFAALIPTAAVVFAFSLGPTDEKFVYDFEHHAGPAAERETSLDDASPRVWTVLLREAQRPDFAHREEALELLVERRVDGVHQLLETIAASRSESEAMRAHARTLLDREPVAAR